MRRKTPKPPLPRLTIAQVRAWGPCYDPVLYLPEDWTGTALDILTHPKVPPQDKLWAACREDWLDAGLLRRFAVAQAKTCRKHVRNKKKFDRVLRVCLRFADGKATQEQLDAAESAARSAAWSTAESAESAARSAAWSAAQSAAGSAAWSAAESAVESAAESAARSAARSTAESAARSAAVRMLARMVREEHTIPRRRKAAP